MNHFMCFLKFDEKPVIKLFMLVRLSVITKLPMSVARAPMLFLLATYPHSYFMPNCSLEKETKDECTSLV